MNIEHHIRTSLKRYVGMIEAPVQLDAAVEAELKRRINRPTNRINRVSATVLVGLAALMITAFSSPSLTDRIYGSFHELKKQIATVTLQEYQRVGLKFAGAKRELGGDYPAFEKLARQMAAVKIQYVSRYYQIDFSTLAPETRLQLKQLYADIQPYFDRLNHAPIARDYLTTEQYDAYIEAQLQRETILAKAGANPSAGRLSTSDWPLDLQADYEKTLQTIQVFEQKVHQSATTQSQVQK